MDLLTVIRELQAEKERLEHTIATLEGFSQSQGKSRRGRKSMGAEERRQVAERMRNYWAGRHKNS